MGATIRLDERHARAYVAEPETAVRGRVLLVHDAYGLTPHVRLLCDELAAHGFVAVAPDLFGEASARSDTDASRLLEALSTPRAERILRAAVAAFDTLGHRRGPAGVVGFSIGAEFAFGLVAGGAVRATVAYYALPSDEQRPVIDTTLLLHLAEHDDWDDDPDLVVDDLRARGVDVVVHRYDGTQHGFGNADIGAYDSDAADLAWRRSVAFLATRLSAA